MEPKPLTAEEEADMNSFTSLGTFGKVKFNWEHFIKSKISGLIISRLYIGSWNLENFQQIFTLTFCENSWISNYDLQKDIRSKSNEKIEISVFNSSSIACRSLLNMLRAQRRWVLKNPVLEEKPMK
jgi:hypothetical protein